MTTNPNTPEQRTATANAIVADYLEWKAVKKTINPTDLSPAEQVFADSVRRFLLKKQRLRRDILTLLLLRIKTNTSTTGE